MPNVYTTTLVKYMYCTFFILLVVQPCCFKNASEAYTRKNALVTQRKVK